MNRRADGVEEECPCNSHTLPPSRTSLSNNDIDPEAARALAKTLRATALTKLEWVESEWVYLCETLLNIYEICLYVVYIYETMV